MVLRLRPGAPAKQGPGLFVLWWCLPFQGFWILWVGSRERRKWEKRDERRVKKKKWEQEEERMPKKAVTYCSCHHLAPLYRFNLSAAVKGNILPRPCRGVTVHRFWWLPWIQMEDSDERMLTVCVAVRRRERRIRSEGRQYCFIDHIHKTAVFLRVGIFNAGMLCSFFQVESH